MKRQKGRRSDNRRVSKGNDIAHTEGKAEVVFIHWRQGGRMTAAIFRSDVSKEITSAEERITALVGFRVDK
jgi:hypothetical protein